MLIHGGEVDKNGDGCTEGDGVNVRDAQGKFQRFLHPRNLREYKSPTLRTAEMLDRLEV